MVVDKLTYDEQILITDLISKRTGLQRNIEMLVKMDMDLEALIHRTMRELMQIHNLDITAGYQFQPNGEITL